jgi:hypothetical protein
MQELKDKNAHDIQMLIKYVMWSKDKVAGGISHRHAVEALSNIIDYPISLMKSISGKDKE